MHREKGLFSSVRVDDIKLVGKKENVNPMWKVRTKKWIWENQHHSLIMSCLLGICSKTLRNGRYQYWPIPYFSIKGRVRGRFGWEVVRVGAAKGEGFGGRGPRRPRTQKHGALQRAGPRRVVPLRWGPSGGALRWGPKGGWAKISLFFFTLRPQFSFFLPSLGGLLVEFWWCLKRRDPEMFTFWVLGLSCEAPAAPKPPGFQGCTQ